MFARRIFSCLAFVAHLLLFAAGTAPAHANWNRNEIKTCVAPVRVGQDVKDLFAGRIALDCKTHQARFGPGDYWVLSEPLSVTGNQTLRSSSVWQNARTVYALYGNGQIFAQRTDSRAASASLQLGAIFLDRLDAHSTPLVRLAWRIEGSGNVRGIIVGPRLATTGESGWENVYLAAIYAAFGGLGLALIVHHLALWVAMKHRFQLAYCIMVALLIFYAFTTSGAIAWVFPGIDNNDRLRLNYAGLGITAAAALAFARTFFEDEVFAGWVGRACTIVAVIDVTAACAYAAFAPWQIFYLDRAYALGFLLLVLFVPVFLARAWVVRSNYLWLFALAWAAPLLFASLRVANNFNIIAWNFWIDNSTVLSMTVEALLSSVGISYRIRLLSQERDEARLQEMAARRLADTDSLTGLLNRRAFLNQAIGREGDQRLMLLDIDHFKLVNETIGHDGGDEVLRLVARTLRTATPCDALVSRLGGEEFAIILPGSNSLDVDDILARLRSTRMPFDLRVTASIGQCRGSLASEADWKQLYRHADKALFDAKNDGRDRARTGALLLAAA